MPIKKVSQELAAQWRRWEERLLAAGRSQRTAHEHIARHHGVSRSTVRRYLVPGE